MCVCVCVCVYVCAFFSVLYLYNTYGIHAYNNMFLCLAVHALLSVTDMHVWIHFIIIMHLSHVCNNTNRHVNGSVYCGLENGTIAVFSDLEGNVHIYMYV